MTRILVTGAGGSPATNFVRSLRLAPEKFELIGVDANKYYLQRAETNERYLVPPADDPDYFPIIRHLTEVRDVQCAYFQTDPEIAQVVGRLDELPLRTLLPSPRTVRILQDKFESYRRWSAAGIRVPRTRLIETDRDVELAFEDFGSPVWIRSVVSHGGGRGSFRAATVERALNWMAQLGELGPFTAAECLTPDSVTWLSIWKNGCLIVAQGRKRLYWEFANRAASGVTGLTGTGVTVADPIVDEVAQRAILAVDEQPNGIFGVDLTCDQRGTPNPTEINVGRFFTTHLFFTRAGLNLPYIYVKLACDEEVALPSPRINPLPPGLAWIRGMDFLPILTTVEEIEASAKTLADLRAQIHR